MALAGLPASVHRFRATVQRLKGSPISRHNGHRAIRSNSGLRSPSTGAHPPVVLAELDGLQLGRHERGRQQVVLPSEL